MIHRFPQTRGLRPPRQTWLIRGQRRDNRNRSNADIRCTQLHVRAECILSEKSAPVGHERIRADCQVSAGEYRLLDRSGERFYDYRAAAINPQKFKRCRNGFGLYIFMWYIDSGRPSRIFRVIENFCGRPGISRSKSSWLSPLPFRVYEALAKETKRLRAFSFVGKSDGNCSALRA